MPDTLAAKSCTPCRGSIPQLTIEEAQARLAQAPVWELLDEGQKIRRTYRFKNFREALGFERRRARLPRPRASPGRCVRLGLRHGFGANQEDQGSTRERLHHGSEARPDRDGVAQTEVRTTGAGERHRAMFW